MEIVCTFIGNRMILIIHNNSLLCIQYGNSMDILWIQWCNCNFIVWISHFFPVDNVTSSPRWIYLGFCLFQSSLCAPCMVQLPETKKSINFNIRPLVLFSRQLHDTLKPSNSVVGLSCFSSHFLFSLLILLSLVKHLVYNILII